MDDYLDAVDSKDLEHGEDGMLHVMAKESLTLTAQNKGSTGSHVKSHKDALEVNQLVTNVNCCCFLIEILLTHMTAHSGELMASMCACGLLCITLC